jgi:hypothetical protein
MSPLFILLPVAAFLISVGVSVAALWGIALAFEGSRITLLLALKCKIYTILATLVAVAAIVLLFVMAGNVPFAWIFTSVIILALVIVDFMIPMRILETGFWRTLSILILTGLVSSGFTKVLSTAAAPYVAPIVQKEAPALQEWAVRMKLIKDSKTASVPLPNPPTAALDQAKKEVDAAQAEVNQLQGTANQTYQALAERKKSLNVKNTAAVQEFNAAAADYAKLKSRLAEKQNELARCQKEVESLQAQSLATGADPAKRVP